MAKMNWNSCRRPGASMDSKRQKAISVKRKANMPATEKQIKLMTALKIQFPKQITKFQAMDLITLKIGSRDRA